MGKTWVYIEPSVKSSSEEAKTLLAKRKKAIQEKLVASTKSALPNSFSTEDSDKPKKKPSTAVANAIKAVCSLNLNVESKGRMLATYGEFEIILEAIQAPSTSKGKLMGRAKTKGGVENAGTVEKEFDASFDQLLNELYMPLVEKTVTSSAFKKNADQNGITL